MYKWKIFRIWRRNRDIKWKHYLEKNYCNISQIYVDIKYWVCETRFRFCVYSWMWCVLFYSSIEFSTIASVELEGFLFFFCNSSYRVKRATTVSLYDTISSHVLFTYNPIYLLYSIPKVHIYCSRDRCILQRIFIWCILNSCCM